VLVVSYQSKHLYSLSSPEHLLYKAKDDEIFWKQHKSLNFNKKLNSWCIS